MSLFPPDIKATAAKIIAEFTAKGLMVVTAESCTGGLIAGALTEIAGSSTVVDRGLVTYTNEAKAEILGVSNETLKTFGAVSRETALEMAAGALKNSRAQISVAVTGIAGPGGGSDAKPVGLVHLAAGNRDGKTIHREMRFGDIGRSSVRLATLRTAFEMLQDIADA